uniref:Inositol-pentakisphosphate 2-kinase n=1 Tax=Plectus sambesii TaxID=2011161 RepID=A0A914WNQ0_9BILA
MIASLVDPTLFRDFCFRGEGRANIVISAKCVKSGRRIVWRIGKDRKTGAVAADPRNQLIVDYIKQQIVPLMGRKFLLVPRLVSFRPSDLHYIAKLPSLPATVKVTDFECLKDEKELPASLSVFPMRMAEALTSFVDALEMADLTRIEKKGRGLHGPRITVEIKPKQGFAQLQAGAPVPYCNNCIFQIEKCHAGNFETMYDFCPLDLFSGDLRRMRRAIRALIRDPHRNLRVFVEGALVHSDEEPLADADLESIFFPNRHAELDHFVDALCYILAGATRNADSAPFSLHDDGVLGRILAAQRQDTVGILRAFELWQSLPEEVQTELKSPTALYFNGLDIESMEPRALLLRYLLAATVKDCSIMLTLRAMDTDTRADVNQEGVIKLPGTSLAFAYHVSVVDLDPKTPKNLISSQRRFLDGVKIIQAKGVSRPPCFDPFEFNE